MRWINDQFEKGHRPIRSKLEVGILIKNFSISRALRGLDKGYLVDF